MVAVFCVFQPKLNLEVFSVSKEVNWEATSVCRGTLELTVGASADGFSWFLSVLSKHFRSRIGKLETTFPINCCDSTLEICDWLEPLQLLQLDVLTLGFRMRDHLCRRLITGHTAPDNYLSALNIDWSEDDVCWAISPFQDGRIMQIRFKFVDAPRGLESHLDTAAKCLQVLRIDQEINEGGLHQREFEISPLNDKGEVVLNRTQVGLAKTSNAANNEHSVEI